MTTTFYQSILDCGGRASGCFAACCPQEMVPE